MRNLLDASQFHWCDSLIMQIIIAAAVYFYYKLNLLKSEPLFVMSHERELVSFFIFFNELFLHDILNIF